MSLAGLPIGEIEAETKHRLSRTQDVDQVESTQYYRLRRLRASRRISGDSRFWTYGPFQILEF